MCTVAGKIKSQQTYSYGVSQNRIGVPFNYKTVQFKDRLDTWPLDHTGAPPLDLDLDNNCQSPDGYFSNGVCMPTEYGHDVADRWLMKDDTEANEVMSSLSNCSCSKGN